MTEQIEIFDEFKINERYLPEIQGFTPIRIVSNPFDIILHMKKMDKYHIMESAYGAFFKIYYNVDYNDVIKYYHLYKAIRMVI